MKIIVAGSRNITNKDAVFDIINKSDFKITEIVSGGARGIDSFGEEWARLYKIPVKKFIPHYAIENPKFAPLLRNMDMANYADGLIAVWDGESKGTAHMISCMRKLDKPVELSELL